MKPAAKTQVLAKFSDGEAAVTVNPFGKGKAYVAGVWPGIVIREKAKKEDRNYAKELVPFKDLRITITGAGNVTKASSAWLQKDLPMQKSGDTLIVSLPELQEGDILILE